ncbi:MAG: RNA pseudouridine synthase [Sulfuricurvum sp. GWF2_44_89]|uniref:RNA pseudouridylate synthase n=1 Tax=Sulfuricurvum kujiense TaxID=148813 RepID=A0A2D3WLI5_9BACT|nr:MULTISPECIES: RluA family pseudouridine synthase [Sulfuricurvum]OHD77727.1 MAG: RNA pseudouridine synthase [Sulfuricurvum sp. GWF2_44_89]OHD90834.1 MAG: RNA pseudouridine synthase [Sulfuricurvum sp. RIFOXYD12_FULL_44_77]OHD92551.1 MAG: RNA pseudouridine synthase [Sulfuricurvum sp. RIFOXYD2_FULL_44_160]DAB38584.1 MAG TPA: RNA pseudouridine synthase [Sulfuricurvum kujiense]
MPFITKQLHSPTRQKAFRFLMQELGITQSEAQRLIAKGRLSQEGEVMANNAGFIEGTFDFICFEPLTLGLEPTFVEEEFAVYDKPSGLLVHPQNRHTPYSLNDEIKHRFGHDANITHRIDQETSGLVLAARNKVSERSLKMMFEERQITKKYLAMVRGHLAEPLDIEEPLLRREDASSIIRMIVRVHPEGKPSRTFIKPLEYFPDINATLVEASPFTGRQHQIRVHLFHVKHPIVGDPIYGQDENDAVRFLDREMSNEERFINTGASRLLLHAHSLEFTYNEIPYHVISKEDFVSQCFDAMKEK